jgi:hypothetical protein
MPNLRSSLIWVPMIAGACGVVRDTPEGVDASASLASSCVGLGASSINKNVQLYLDGDAMKPYLAHDFLSIPFGSGRSCVSGTAQTVATIDLTGTHFALAASQTWTPDGFSAGAQAAINPQRTMATITATGFPVGASPCAPNVDYYTLNGGTCLHLEYVP